MLGLGQGGKLYQVMLGQLPGHDPCFNEFGLREHGQTYGLSGTPKTGVRPINPPCRASLAAMSGRGNHAGPVWGLLANA